MQFNEFLGQVQSRARLADMQHALRATRATLQTLGERISQGEAWDLASQLPRELGEYLREISGARADRFDIDEFLRRVCEREGVALAAGTYHVRVVMEVVREAVSPGEWRDVEAQLPEDLRQLLASGSQGNISTRS